MQANTSGVSPCLDFVAFLLHFLPCDCVPVLQWKCYLCMSLIMAGLAWFSNVLSFYSYFSFFQRGVGIQLFDCLKFFTPHWIMKMRREECCFHWENQSSNILSCQHPCVSVVALDVWREMSTIFWTCSWRLPFVVMNCGPCLQVSVKVVVNASSDSSCITKETESSSLLIYDTCQRIVQGFILLL